LGGRRDERSGLNKTKRAQGEPSSRGIGIEGKRGNWAVVEKPFRGKGTGTRKTKAAKKLEGKPLGGRKKTNNE